MRVRGPLLVRAVVAPRLRAVRAVRRLEPLALGAALAARVRVLRRFQLLVRVHAVRVVERGAVLVVAADVVARLLQQLVVGVVVHI